PIVREKAQLMRFQQVSRFLDLVRVHILEKNEPLIVAGDFNAVEGEQCLTHLLDSAPGFMRLRPENDGPTHPDLARAVDHIYFYPRARLVDYVCRIESNDLSRRASDHLPVVADLQIK
ncbi:MAG: endonuclease/exonuclease/phosphatase family protein, partial [Desulfosarcina sp.]|nr:endonuclease/exonuclease/phosphatase family protein [Desulfosarcina sp.]